ncbi:hypothetical protein A6X21_11295 [Planctopirus hydrillae]|uniref:Uncharacterized protein n=1 Tax=Planctopirus hydrillae TaxID=1841610 RepID=A0A1C3E6E9_9PLAN|nr:hypothetical protein A6X21_11295 [Planctopirus hydrillae]
MSTTHRYMSLSIVLIMLSILIAFLFLSIPKGDKPSERTDWYEGFSRNFSPFLNSYDSSFDTYPDFAFVIRNADDFSDSSVDIIRACESSITECRNNFKSAYAANGIHFLFEVRGETELDGSSPLLTSKIVTGRPKWIHFITCGGKRSEQRSNTEEVSLHEMIYFGVIIDASEVFEGSKAPSELIDDSYSSWNSVKPIRKNRSATIYPLADKYITDIRDNN